MTSMQKIGTEWHNPDLDGPHTEQEGEIAALANGGYVIAWIDSNDGYTAAVRAQQFDNTGTPVGAEIVVDQGPGVVSYSAKSNVTVAGLPDGHFVVSWDQNYAGYNGNGVLARVYDEAGQALGATFPITTYSYDFPFSESPKILPAVDGTFWIIAENFINGSGQGFFVQHLDQAGTRIGGRVNLLTFAPSIDVRFPEIARLADGRIAVGWSEADVTAGSDYAAYKIQIFDQNFANGGTILTVAQSTNFGDEFWHDGIVALPDGGFALEWLAWSQTGNASIYVQTFDSGGNARALPALVTAASSSQLSNADIVLNGAGDLVVSWIAPDGLSVIGQKVSAAGNLIGTAFEISPDASQRNVHLVALTGGKFVAQFTGPADNVGNGWAISAQAFNLSISDGTSGNNTLNGTGYDNLLNGLGGNDILNGLGGDDTLKGGAGNDTLDGGTGNDSASYADADGPVKVSLLLSVAQNTGVAAGTDKLTSIENLIGSAFADTLTGNNARNRIEGLDGNDKIDGKADADTMAGGLGNDSYVVDNAGDVIIEMANEGTDSISASINYTLGANLEKLTLSGTANLNGTGNELANSLTGNGGANHLYGLDGNDILDGKAGADTMVGGVGNDTYTVDIMGDVIVENANEGTDTVKSSISYTLGLNLEKLILNGVDNLDGIGNELGNSLTGNAGANHLNGLAGKDILSGGLGDDWLSGGLGGDTLTGGAGKDRFVFDVLETFANRDTIKDFEHGIDDILISRSAYSAFAGSVAGALSTSAFVVGVAATTAAHRIVYNNATGGLSYDPDGLGGQAQIQIATLSTKPVLDAADFLLI